MERIVKAAGEKQFLTYEGRQIRFTAYLSTEIWQTRKEWQDIFKMLNWKNMQLKNTLSSKAIIKNKRDKEVPRKTGLKEFMATKPALKRNFKGDSLSGEKKNTKRNKD